MSGRRVVLSAAVAAVWLSAAVLWVVSGAGDDPLGDVERLRSDPNEPWLREDVFYAYDNATRYGGVQGRHLVDDDVTFTDPFRVLVLGDSFTFGAGLVDPDVRWSNLLAERLDELVAPGSFDVVALAHGGASTFTHAIWLERLVAGDPDGAHVGRRRDRVTDPFDVVVVGYVYNDIFPEPYFDDPVPVRWFDEVRRRAGSDADVELGSFTPAEQSAILAGDRPYPYTTMFEVAVDDLISFAAPVPVLWMPLTHHDYDRATVEQVRDVYAAAGAVPVDDVTTRALQERYGAQDLMVTPVDNHPGTALQHAYAADAADAVVEVVDPARLAWLRDSATSPVRSLISSVTPTRLEATTDARSGSVRVGELFVSAGRCVDIIHMFGGFFCDADGPFIEVHGERLLPQFAPCRPFGHQHAIVFFDRHRRGATVEVVVEASSPVALATYGYDHEGFAVSSPLADAAVEHRVEVVLDEMTTGVVVVDTSSGCDSDSVIDLPMFTLDAVETRDGARNRR